MMRVKIFSATRPSDRERLDLDIERWLNSKPEKKILEREILQSSDQSYHCLTFVFFYQET